MTPLGPGLAQDRPDAGPVRTASCRSRPPSRPLRKPEHTTVDLKGYYRRKKAQAKRPGSLAKPPKRSERAQIRPRDVSQAAQTPSIS